MIFVLPTGIFPVLHLISPPMILFRFSNNHIQFHTVLICLECHELNLLPLMLLFRNVQLSKTIYSGIFHFFNDKFPT